MAVWDQDPGSEVEYALIGNDVTDQLAYAHEPRRPIKFLDITDEEKLTQFLSKCKGGSPVCEIMHAVGRLNCSDGNLYFMGKYQTNTLL